MSHSGQQLLHGVAEDGLLPLQDAAVVRGTAQLSLQPDDQPTLPLQQLVELPLLTLQALQLPAVATLQRQQTLLQEAAEAKQTEDIAVHGAYNKCPLHSSHHQHEKRTAAISYLTHNDVKTNSSRSSLKLAGCQRCKLATHTHVNQRRPSLISRVYLVKIY